MLNETAEGANLGRRWRLPQTPTNGSLAHGRLRCITQAERGVIVVTLAGLLIIAIVELANSLHLQRAVLRPVAQLQQSAAKLAAGQWDIARAKASADEIGVLHHPAHANGDGILLTHGAGSNANALRAATARVPRPGAC